jgi:sugar lactone lactonase YvrE
LVLGIALCLLLASVSAALGDESESIPGEASEALEAGAAGPEEQLTNQVAAEELPHENLGREEAAELTEAVFEPELESGTGIFDELKFEEFLSDYAAVIPPGDAPEPSGITVGPETQQQYEGPTLLQTTVPLATQSASGERESVDLSLESTSMGFAPSNPLVPLHIPGDLLEGIEVGSAGIGLKLLGAPAERAPSLIGDNVAFYPNVGEDTDFSVSPTPTGAETFSILRSSQAPQIVRYQFSLPADEVLKGDGNGGAVVAGASGEALLTVAAPKAVDASGIEVPVEMEVESEASVLRLTVQADSSTEYPILVDPVIDEYKWYENNTTAGTSSFKEELPPHTIDYNFGTSWTPALANPGLSLNSPGLYIQASPECCGKNWAYWGYAVPRLKSDEETFGAPPTSFIASMDLHDVGFFNEWNTPGYHYVDPINEPLFKVGTYDPYNDSWPIEWTHGINEGPITNFGIQYHLPGNNDHNAKIARPVGLYNPAANYSWRAGVPRTAYVGYAAIALGDEDAPRFGSVTSPPWNDGTAEKVSVPLTVSDIGLGIKQLSLTDPVNVGHQREHQGASPPGSCWSPSSPCPRTWRSSDPGQPQVAYEPAKLPSGITKLTLTARDVVGNHTSATVQAKIDRTAPEIFTYRQIAGSASIAYKPLVAELNVKAFDGSASAPQSGIRSVEIKVDGTTVKSVGCEKENCSIDTDYFFHSSDYKPGEHKLRVVATDRVGHVSSREWSIQVEKDVSPPTIGNFKVADAVDPSKVNVSATLGGFWLGLKKVELLVDGKQVEGINNVCADVYQDEDEGVCLSETAPGKYEPLQPVSFTLSKSSFALGQHIVELVATDGGGNTSREQTEWIIRSGGAASVPSDLGLSGTMTEQAKLGLERPRYVLRAAAAAGDETGGPASPISRYKSSLGISGAGSGQFSHPGDVGTDSKGNLWVLDKGNNRIEKFNEAGEFQKEAGGLGIAAGKLSGPSALAVDSNGNVWVSDTGNNRVVEFSEAGAFLEILGSNVNKTKVEAGGSSAEKNLCTAASGNTCQAGTAGSSPGQMNAPLGIAAPTSGGVWVVDTGNNRLEKFNKESGANTAVVSGEGSEPGKLKGPSAVAFAANGSFWVADSGNNRIEEWNSGFGFERAVGKEGAGNGEFKGPAAIDVDATGNVWVADQNNNRVEEFSETGAYLGKFGIAGAGPGQFGFSSPIGVTVDAKGNIWVTDPGTNRVEKWALSNSENGVAKVEILMDSKVVATSQTGCSTTNCAVILEWTMTSSAFSSGIHTAIVKATSRSGTITTKALNVELRRDATKPALSAKGGLIEGPDGWLEQKRYGFEAEATDVNGSGLTSLLLKVDGGTAEKVSRSCLDGGCNGKLTTPINTADYSGGSHNLQLVATDGAGNVSSKSWTINIDPQGYVGPGEANSTLKAVEETAGVNTVGPTTAEEIDGTTPGLSFEEGANGLEVEGGVGSVNLSANPNGACATELKLPAHVEGPEGLKPSEEAEILEKASEEKQEAEEESPSRTEISFEPTGIATTVAAVQQQQTSCQPKLITEAAAVDTNTELEVDTLMRPLYDGSMTFKAIRGPEAPESYSWSIDLGEGQSLKAAGEGTAEVYYQDETPAMSIIAEAAHDATGKPVPTSLQVENNIVTLTVHYKEQGASYTYPILAGANYEIGHEEVTITYPPEPEEESAGEVEVEEGAVDHISIMEVGPPRRVASGSSSSGSSGSGSSGSSASASSASSSSSGPFERQYKFTYCFPHHIPGNPADVRGTPAVEGDHRSNLSRETAECHRKDEHGVFWGTTVHGWFKYLVHHWVEVPWGQEQCDKWGDEQPAMIHCVDTPLGRQDGPVSVYGEYRFGSDRGEWGYSLHPTCLWFGGEIYPREEPSGGGPYMAPRIYKHKAVRLGESCPW